MRWRNRELFVAGICILGGWWWVGMVGASLMFWSLMAVLSVAGLVVALMYLGGVLWELWAENEDGEESHDR